MDSHALDVLGFAAVRGLLAGYAGSPLGRALAERISPSADARAVEASLAQVDEALGLLARGVEPPVRGLDSASAILRVLRSTAGAGSVEPLAAVGSRIAAIQRLLEDLRGRSLECPRLAELARLAPDLRVVLARLAAMLDGDTVRDTASDLLQRLRREKAEAEVQVRALLDGLAASARLRPHLMERGVALRNGRLVLVVRSEHAGQVPGLLHDRSASGSSVFIEPKEAVVLGNALADIAAQEARELDRLLAELTRLLLDHEAEIAGAEARAAWIDHSFGRARMSLALGLSAPRQVAELTLHLRRACHPVLLHASKQPGGAPVVPMDLCLTTDRRLLVVTGPNTGGKTVALRTAGLIQLMFQSGLHIPAAPGSELTVLEDVLADIGDEQDIAQSLSTFAGHIRSVTPMLQPAGSRRLLLIDEFGSGTDPVEGAALGEAMLEHLLRTGCLAVVTTHLGMLKAFAFSRPGAENASMSFDAETLRPTYELVTGIPGSSQALAVAVRYGVPAEVVERARTLLQGGREREVQLLDDLARARHASELARLAAEAMKATSAERLGAADEELRRAQGERGRLELEAEQEVRRVLDALNDALRPHVAALSSVPPALRSSVEAVAALLADHVRFSAFSERRRVYLTTLRKHDSVWVPRYGQTCRIEKLDRARERLTVRVGNLSMELGFADISFVTQPDAPQR
ncbi:MAG: hypothetical protein EXS14_03410 [Planctomycetes bacterium]|nr:hypothetical protein [Planctomycetota bacterium]